jgi:hypothetical protein
MEPQQEGGQGSQSPTANGGTSTATAGLTRAQRMVMQQKHFAQMAMVPTPRDATSTGGATSGSSSSGSSSQSQSNDQTQFQFDKNGMCTIQSKDTSHLITVDQQNKKITIQVPDKETIFVGGDGKKGKYSDIMTLDGPVINAKGRIS